MVIKISVKKNEKYFTRNFGFFLYLYGIFYQRRIITYLNVNFSLKELIIEIKIHKYVYLFLQKLKN